MKKVTKLKSSKPVKISLTRIRNFFEGRRQTMISIGRNTFKVKNVFNDQRKLDFYFKDLRADSSIVTFVRMDHGEEDYSYTRLMDIIHAMEDKSPQAVHLISLPEFSLTYIFLLPYTTIDAINLEKMLEQFANVYLAFDQTLEEKRKNCAGIVPPGKLADAPVDKGKES